MKTRKKTIKLNYEPEADVLSWKLNNEAIDFAEESGNMVVHFNKNNAPVYVEILQASEFLSKASGMIRKSASKPVNKELVLV